MRYRPSPTEFTVSLWNLNGWTVSNTELKEGIIKATNSDVVCLCETHLKNNDKITLQDYIFYGHNRQTIHSKARKGSGGVGICIKNSIRDMFDISVISETYEGILVVGLHHRVSEFNVTIVLTYLPPESSNWGRDCETFFSNLLSIVYLESHTDLFVLCGDLNARIGRKVDFINGIDNSTPRQMY